MRNQVNTCYCCEWLLCILGLYIGVLHGEPGNYMLRLLSYHVFLTHMVYLQTEAANGWLNSKCTTQTRSRKNIVHGEQG